MSNTNPPVRGRHAILRGVPGALTGAAHLGLVVTTGTLAAAAVAAVIVPPREHRDTGTGRRRPGTRRQPSGQPFRSARIWPASPARKRPAQGSAP